MSLSFENIIDSIEGFEEIERGKTHYGNWLVLQQKESGILFTSTNVVIIYFVNGNITEEHEDDFLSTYLILWDNYDFNKVGAKLYYTGKCNLSSLTNKIKSNLSNLQIKALSIEWMQSSESNEDMKTQIKEGIEEVTYNRKIFVVHGHDEEMKVSVARTLEHLDLEPIILMEKASRGKTLIEKIYDNSDVRYAVVLISPDDIAYKMGDSKDTVKLRARQNVIFELGFFMGKLGRDKVTALYKNGDDFEFPTDYKGILYIPFDKIGRWKYELIKELRASGVEVDANKII